MKKVGIDMSHYGKLSGYGVVATNIINRLVTSNKYQFYLLSTNKQNLPENLKNKKNIHWIISNTKFYFLYRLFTQSYLLKKYNIDIYYSPDQIVPILKNKKCIYISTIHDLFCRMNYSGFNAFKLNKIKDKIYYFLNIDKIFVKKSKYIITPSNASKKDIINNFHISEDKIMMYHRGMEHINGNTKKKNNIDYILFPLCSDCNDHFIFHLGEEILKNKYVNKIIYWKPQGGNQKIKKYSNNKMDIILNKISEEEKIDLISKAKIAIYISEMEGFGFPPLECQILKTPIIYRNIGSLGEVIGETGIGINGFNIKEYLSYIKELINNDRLYNELQKKGSQNAKKYSWDEVKLGIESIFDNCINS